jgi:hypothetical protein
MTKLAASVAFWATDVERIGTARIAAHNRQEVTMSTSPSLE